MVRTARNRILLLAAIIPLGGCTVTPPPFTPGVEGRAANEVCQSSSSECQQWTELARKCEENMRKRDAGDMSPQRPYCTQAESLREQASGVANSSDPGAYNF